MRELIFKNDKYKMNWVEGEHEWGTVKAPEGISAEVRSEREGDVVREEYIFTNTSDRDIFTSLCGIGIYTPFNDDYCDSATCVTNRCHTHIWCGGDIGYVMALRMGGDAPHLGLVLTEGSLSGYSVERDFAKMSNDRGDFILHPAPAALAPGESMRLAWTLFPHEGKADFYNKLAEYNPKFIAVSAENYIVFPNERIHIEAKKDGIVSAKVTRDAKRVSCAISGSGIVIDEQPTETGEYSYQIEIDGAKTHCNILCCPEPEELAGARCAFIAAKQQYINPESRLSGAYLVYDNEEKHVFYSRDNDMNAGRERVGMALLMAKYLQKHSNAVLAESLKRYIEFEERELVDAETGLVTNDYMRDDSYERLYNYPWYATLNLELYDLFGEERYLVIAYRILRMFYKRGGAQLYAIELPLDRILEKLADAGMDAEREELYASFVGHGEYIIANGIIYPAHEVNYEQSIAAPAADIMAKLYAVTGEEKYLDGLRLQMKALEAFSGLQPDYHMYEVAIRHWDGYWFGKRRLYGDTYPHYWSALTANVYRRCAELTGDGEYLKKAEAAQRAVLSLISPDGAAACAYVYPTSVNGVKADFADPYANDQDWGLYFMLRSMD